MTEQSTKVDEATEHDQLGIDYLGKEKLRTKQCNIDSLLGGQLTLSTELNSSKEKEQDEEKVDQIVEKENDNDQNEKLDTSVEYKLNDVPELRPKEDQPEMDSQNVSQNNCFEISIDYKEENEGEIVQQMNVKTSFDTPATSQVVSQKVDKVDETAKVEDEEIEEPTRFASDTEKSLKIKTEPVETATENDASDFETEENMSPVHNTSLSRKKTDQSEANSPKSEFSVTVPVVDDISTSITPLADTIEVVSDVVHETIKAPASYVFDSNDEEDDDNETYELNKCIEDFNNELQQINDNIVSNLTLTPAVKLEEDSSFDNVLCFSNKMYDDDDDSDIDLHITETNDKPVDVCVPMTKRAKSGEEDEDEEENQLIRKAESELDVSNLHLNLSESFKDDASSEKLKELISEIEQEIETDLSCNSVSEVTSFKNNTADLGNAIKMISKMSMHFALPMKIQCITLH